MSGGFDSDKDGLWIVLGIIALAAVVWLMVMADRSYVEQTIHNEYASKRAQTETKREFQDKCSVLTAPGEIANCLTEYIESRRETERAEENLYAQRQMADWAYWILAATLLVGFVSAGVTGAGIYFVKRTLEETSRQAEAAVLGNAIMMEGNRAWLKVKVAPNGPIDISPDQISMRFKSTITNIGNRPAINVKVHHRIINSTIFWATDEAVPNFLKEIINSKLHKWPGRVIFPGEPFKTNNFSGSVRRDEGPDFHDPSIKRRLCFIVCVTYRANPSDTYFHTAEIYLIEETPDASHKHGWKLMRIGDAQIIT